MSVLRKERANRVSGQVIHRVGFWSAVLTTLFAVGFTLAFAVDILTSPSAAAGWQGLEAYAASFSSVRMAMVLVPSLLLAPSFVALIACLHGIAPAEKRVWSRIGLAFAIMYAVIASFNYTTQLIVVRGNLLNGETEGLALLVMGNPLSLFWALAILGYNLYMALAGLLVVPTLGEGTLDRWIGLLFAVNAAASILGLVTYFVTLNNLHPIGLLATAVWCIGFPGATWLLAVRFRRA